MSYYRIQTSAYPVEMILDPEHQTSENYSNPEDIRAGKSVCASIEDLAEYLAQTGIPFDDSYLLVEVEGYASDDEDADAHMGAMLIHPTRIISAELLSDEFFEMINEAFENLTD